MVDTSALVALVNDEPEAERFHSLLLDHEPLISCGTLIETLRVMQVSLGPRPGRLDRLIELYGIEPVLVDAEQAALARAGMLAYGKGRGEAPAVLNFGDLFAYALARQLHLPLLFKGDDFSATDIAPVPGGAGLRARETVRLQEPHQLSSHQCRQPQRAATPCVATSGAAYAILWKCQHKWAERAMSAKRREQDLMEKIHRVPEAGLPEVEDFVDLLRQRQEERRLAQVVTDP